MSRTTISRRRAANKGIHRTPPVAHKLQHQAKWTKRSESAKKHAHEVSLSASPTSSLTLPVCTNSLTQSDQPHDDDHAVPSSTMTCIEVTQDDDDLKSPPHLMLSQASRTVSIISDTPSTQDDRSLAESENEDLLLPDGVVDIYRQTEQRYGCICGMDHSSGLSTTASYVSSYGKIFWDYHRIKEEKANPPPISLGVGSGGSIASDSCDQSSMDDSLGFLDNIEPHSLQTITEVAEHLPNQPDLTPKMRSILVDWIIELSEHFSFGAKTLHLAITMVDRVLACGPLMDDDDDDGNGITSNERLVYNQSNQSEADDTRDSHDSSRTDCLVISRERFQLLGTACTWVACKLEEVSAPTIHDFAYVADGIYSLPQIKRMERRICKALDFRLRLTTPFCFLFEFLMASNECSCSSTNITFEHLAHYLLELSRLSYAPTLRKPSLLAASAVYLARATLHIRSGDTSSDACGLWTPTLAYYTNYSKPELHDTVLELHRLHTAAEQSNLKSVFNKYESHKYHQVSLKTVAMTTDLGF